MQHVSKMPPPVCVTRSARKGSCRGPTRSDDGIGGTERAWFAMSQAGVAPFSADEIAAGVPPESPTGVRFSLFSLEDGEEYLERVHAECTHKYGGATSPTPMDSDGRATSPPLYESIEGWLRICTCSLIFEPFDLSLPLLRLPFRAVTDLAAVTSSGDSEAKGGRQRGRKKSMDLTSQLAADRRLLVKAGLHVEMKLNGRSQPHRAVKQYSELDFTMLASRAKRAGALAVATAAWQAFSKPDREQRIEAMVANRANSLGFNERWLDVDSGEAVLYQCLATRITPQGAARGRLTVTSGALMWQAFSNAPDCDERGCLRHGMGTARAIFERRHVHRMGIEVYFSNRESMFLVFEGKGEHMTVAAQIRSQPAASNLSDPCPADLQRQWVRGELCNFDYILLLNVACGRSFNDLAQYPVFPWVIADYTSEKLDLTEPATFRDLSKPVGALNPERLRSFQSRREQSVEGEDEDEDPVSGDISPRARGFLYGSHYSSPTVVKHFLLRSLPDATLQLQSGKWDKPDRVFRNIIGAWQSSLNSPADVKELTPEFYNTAMNCGEFLLDLQSLELGRGQDDELISHVQLPPWASSAYNFVSQCRAALESAHASSMLHSWVDLIFGHAQRGVPALKANNLFYHLTYVDTVEFGDAQDTEMQHALALQINEFGQCPMQAFTKPHPHQSPQVSRSPSLHSIENVPNQHKIVSDEQLATMKRVFGAVDKHGVGEVSTPQLMAALSQDSATRRFFHLPARIRQEDGTRESFEELIQRIVEAGDDTISWHGFVDWFWGGEWSEAADTLQNAMELINGGSSSNGTPATLKSKKYRARTHASLAPDAFGDSEELKLERDERLAAANAAAAAVTLRQIHSQSRKMAEDDLRAAERAWARQLSAMQEDLVEHRKDLERQKELHAVELESVRAWFGGKYVAIMERRSQVVQDELTANFERERRSWGADIAGVEGELQGSEAARLRLAAEVKELKVRCRQIRSASQQQVQAARARR